jgi:hypothetical protein
MDPQSYQDGRAGNAPGPNTDYTAYQSGRADREREAAQQGPAEKRIDWGSFFPKANVSGVGLAIFLMAPFLWMPYPVLGLSLMGVFGAIVMLMRWLHVPSGPAVLIGLLPCVLAFFWAMALEVKASQFPAYRWFRMAWRPAIAFVFASALGTTGNIRTATPDKLTAAGIIIGLIAAFLAHKVFRAMDRIYFRVPELEQKEQEEALTRAKAFTEIAGTVSDVAEAGRNRWTYRVGDKRAFITGRAWTNVGHEVRALGYEGPEFDTLVLVDRTTDKMSVAEMPSWRNVTLSIVGILFVSVLTTPLIGVLLIPGVWWLHRQRKQRIQAIVDATARLERQQMPVTTEATPAAVPADPVWIKGN